MQFLIPEPDSHAPRVKSANSSIASDVDLTHRVAAGDPDAVGELYILLRKLLSPQIRFRLREEPDDLLHETLTIVVESIRNGSLRQPEALRRYSGSVVRKLIAGRIIGVVWTRRRTVNASDMALHTDETPESTMLDRERLALMELGLKQLRSRDSELLTRFYIHGQSYLKICDDMHLTQTQFRLFKSRAKAKLTAWAKAVA
ncbi:MAG: sigma-70 family RNA polymerase sigma factor [Bryobacterales bacterium]|nr:sigma-70 family RNA polymerase sigma factor [Bryobacterales bacterium]